MSRQTAEKRPVQTTRRDRADLDRQYGNIGISAVAAALPYSGKAKNPAYAPSQELPRHHSAFGRRSIFAD